MGSRAIHVLDRPNIAFLSTLNHHDSDTNEPVLHAAAHAWPDHATYDGTTTT